MYIMHIYAFNASLELVERIKNLLLFAPIESVLPIGDNGFHVFALKEKEGNDCNLIMIQKLTYRTLQGSCDVAFSDTFLDVLGRSWTFCYLHIYVTSTQYNSTPLTKLESSKHSYELKPEHFDVRGRIVNRLGVDWRLSLFSKTEVHIYYLK